MVRGDDSTFIFRWEVVWNSFEYIISSNKISTKDHPHLSNNGPIKGYRIMKKVFNPWDETERNLLIDYLKNSLKPNFVDENPLFFTQMFLKNNGYNLRESLLQLSEYNKQYNKNMENDQMVLKSMY